MKFKDLDMYLFIKAVILIYTKHVLNEECFPDGLNNLFVFIVLCTNCYSPLILPVVLERAPGNSVSWDTTLVNRTKYLRQFV